MREVDPNFVMAAWICVPDAQHVEKDSTSTVHADLPLSQNQVVSRIRTRPTIHLARLLVLTTVNITLRTVSINFFPIPRFFAKWLLVCSNIMVKNDLPLRGGLRNDTREMTAC